MSFDYTKVTQTGTELNIGKLLVHLVFGTVLVIVLFGVLFGSWATIVEGERGLVLKLGKIDRIMEPGFHFKTPWIEKVVKMEVRTQKKEVQASAASNDLQVVTSNIAIQYNVIPENIGLLYQEVGIGYRARIIDPAIQDAIKATTAKYTAEELITKREIVSEEVEEIMRARLLEAHLAVTNVDIVNFDFSTSFNAAIEAKVTAEQKAKEAENKLEQVKFEAQQSIEKAKAEATRTRLEVEALRLGSDLIEKIRAEAALKAAETWNGSVPQTVIIGGGDGGDIPIFPFLNIGAIKSQ